MRDLYASTWREQFSDLAASAFGRAARDAPAYEFHILKLLRDGWNHDNRAALFSNTAPGRPGLAALYREQGYPGGTEYRPVLREPEICGRLDQRNLDIFLAGVHQARARLQPYVAALLAEFGTALKLGRTMLDINPDYKGIACRGQEGSLEHRSGLYERATNLVAVTQGYLHPELGLFVRNGEGHELNAVLHEYGHALEEIVFCEPAFFNDPFHVEPHQRDFVRAHRRDVMALGGMAASGEKSLIYYLTKENGGSHETEQAACSETFAQLYAEKTAGDERQIMQTAFPETSAVMNRILSSLEQMFEASPRYGHVRLPSLAVPVQGASVQ